MQEQLPLFTATKASAFEKRNLRVATEAWIADHPKAAALFLKFAHDLAGLNRHFGIALLAERIRWECAVEGWQSDEYKINNSHRAYLARWLIAQDPSLETFIEFREVRFK